MLVGQGKKYKQQVEERIKKLKLDTRVHILGSIEHAELPTLYQAAKVFCFPSLFEGFGIPIIEALFSGTPVITSLGSCFPESAGPDSIFIDPLSHSDISKSLIYLLGDSSLQNSMRIKGLEFVQRFHLKNTTNQLMDYYRQVTA